MTITRRAKRVGLLATLLAGGLMASACQLPANVAAFVQDSGPGGSSLTGHTITNGAATSDDTYTLTGSGTSVVAFAGPQVDGNEREAIWYDNAPTAQNEEGCETINDSPGLTQDGVMLHVNQGTSGVVTGIAVDINIWMGAKWIVNIYSVTGDTSDDGGAIGSIQGGYDMSPVLGGASGPFTPYPWNLCARTVGNQVQFVIWTGAGSAPAFGSPGQSGSATIPDTYMNPGKVGWWLGHIPAGSNHTISGLNAIDNDNQGATS